MVDWEGLKAKNFEPLIRALNIQIQIDEDGTDVGVSREAVHFACVYLSQFPAILAAHERDQRVIEAAEKCANAAEQARSWMTMPKGVEGEPSTVASVGRRQKQIIAALTDALAEYDKAKR